MKPPITVLAVLATPLWRSVSAWRIEMGGAISEEMMHASLPRLQIWQQERRTPPNTADPDYFHPSSTGGHAQHNGHNGAVVFVAHVHTGTDPTRFESVDVPPLELRASFFLKENVVQEYVVPGDGQRRPYKQEVTVKAWGAGGGGCDGGRGESTEPLPEEDEDGTIDFSEGSGGGFVEASFNLPVGDRLRIVVGGGGMSQGSLPDSLGGKGGYNGGYPGKDDGTSGGGGGGGMTTVSFSNGAVIAAAYGGVGGGNTTYCAALGGVGASLRGQPKDAGGYINFDLALSGVLEEEATCPGVPTITSLTHESAEFTWNAGFHQSKTSKELYVKKYTVQLSEGSLDEGEDEIVCSEDYKLHKHIQRSFDVTRNATTTLDGLRASAPYCIRVEAFSVEGLSLGAHVVSFTTNNTPVNKWLPVAVRQARAASALISKANANDIGSMPTWCEHSPARPTGRRGHSMTVIDDHVYILGGATLKCVCEHSDSSVLEDEAERMRSCSSKTVYSNELWHFDPLTAMFTQLERNSGDEPWPRGREQHSATALPNGDIIVIGGTTSPNDDLEIGADSYVLSDVWRLRDPHRTSSGSFVGKDLSEDAMPLELMPGRITSNQMRVSLRDNDVLGGDAMCITDIRVKISLVHGCLIESIKLTGPGTIDAIDDDSPQSRDYEAKIFIGNMESRGHECQTSSLNLSFYDDADESVLSYASIPASGTFRPVSSLMSTFGNLPVNGEWKISVSLSQPIYQESYHGSLLNWELKIDAKPCVARAKWEELPTPPPSFSPRRLHTAVAVDNSIFATGGFANRSLNDLWRFDYGSNTWTELDNSTLTGHWPLNGQVAFLGQYGLLAYGGIANGGSPKQGNDLWLMDLFEDDWVHVPIAQDLSDDGHFNKDIPYARYLSSIGFLYNVNSIYNSYSIEGKGPLALVFGGDGRLLHNTYADSYGFIPNSFFDDVWLLSPGGVGVSSSMNLRRREDYCEWRWIPGSTALKLWKRTCGWNASVGGDSGECRLKDVLIAAWCRGQFQSFYMSRP